MPPAPFHDIAIIGIACRFPGAPNREAFWNNLIGGVESIACFSDEELRSAGVGERFLRDPHYVKAAPIIDRHDEFDAGFFGYSPREARLMDPQQRHFLEVAWEAFEDAGYDPLGNNGVVGIYAGVGGMVSSYLLAQDDPELRGQTGDLGHIGNDRDFLPSRVAFKLDLTGPAVNVQTACSTSLVAVHLACRALLDGEAAMALAGASVVRVPHIAGYLAEPGGINSPDGHCRPFDADGSGTLFGSGVAAIVLKPLEIALAGSDHIYAVIKGSAVTNDGALKVNYTASTVRGQARAMAEALALSGVEPDDIGYVECHGTATTLGDPLEIQALTRAFRKRTQRSQFCAIGSVKSNFGHLEQCAGLAGLIKTALALERSVIPPSLHFNAPNPRIPFERSPFFVNAEVRPFARGETPRRAAVNSVGMGGTNAFLVLEEAPDPPRREPTELAVFALALSVKTTPALAVQAANFAALLAGENPPELRDLCFTANCGRHHFEHRLCAVGATHHEIAQALSRCAAGARPRSSAAPGLVAFLYSGQGAQYPRMGEELYQREPVFRIALDRCFELFEAEGLELRETFFGSDKAQLTRTLFAQPALYSLQIALTKLWRCWGVTPDIVVGHSVGEFAAAVAVGACTIEEAAHLVVSRARLMETLPRRGGMASIAADPARARDLLAEFAGELAVAAENAPDRTVVSGRRRALAAYLERCRREGIPVAPLQTSHAFHSQLMEPMLDAFEALAAAISFRAPRSCWISTLTGDVMTAAPDAIYWRDQIREPVCFRQALTVAARQAETFLEIGPGATLTALGRRCNPGAAQWLCSLQAERDDQRTILESLGELYRQGRPINWEAVQPRGGRRVSLPTYPFQHQRYWLESRRSHRIAAQSGRPRAARPSHPLLGERLGGEEVRFEGLLSLERFAFLGDHRVFGEAVLPTAAIFDLVTAAAEASGLTAPVLEEFVYEHALTIAADRPVWTALLLDNRGAGASFRLQSTGMMPGDPWVLHASGVIRNDLEPVGLPPFPSHLKRAAAEIPPDLFYRFLDESGLSYGPAFRGVRSLWRDRDQVFAEIAAPVGAGAGRRGYEIDPAFLDACLHVYAALAAEHGRFERAPSAATGVYVPISLDAFRLYRTGIEHALVHGSVVERGDAEARLKVDIHIYTDDGMPVALLRGLTLCRVRDRLAAPQNGTRSEGLLYTVAWREAPLSEGAAISARRWHIVADKEGIGEQLARALTMAGAAAVIVPPDEAAPGRLLDEPPDSRLGIVYLRGLDAPLVSDASPETPSAARICGGVLDLAKALDRARDRFAEPPLLLLVTHGGKAALAQSPLWGFGRSFALEYPEMWGGLVALPQEAAPAEAAALMLRHLHSGDGERQLRHDNEKRLAPRLVPLAEGSEAKACLATDATYWIVGGLGRLGLETAEALIEAGARHLALTGRSTAPPSTAAMLDKLRSRAEVRVIAADLGDDAAVAAAVREIGATMPPLKGIIHAAAVFEDALLVNADLDLFERVLRPKAAGAWNLHRATIGCDLDFFVLYSTVLSVWGAAGQAAYAAANSFLDALAHYRRAHGLPATVFNWGPWDEVDRWGPVGAAMWRQRATNALPSRICLRILLSHLGAGPAQVVVTDTNWPVFLAQFDVVPELYRELAPAAQPFRDPVATGIPDPLGGEDAIAEHAAQVLGLTGRIDPARPLNELGLDSLLAVTLANRLRRAFDRAVPTAVLLKGPSIRELAGRLFPELTILAAVSAPKTPGAALIAGGRWLVIHRPNPAAKLRLFAFPFAGGGAATFRHWSERLDPSIELVAVEPPGRQTRIDEPPIRDLDTLLRQLMPHLLPFLDKPFAVYGHCLGALTLFETVRRLIGRHGIAPVHVFVSGARPPDELQRQQDFEADLLDRLLKLPEYNLFEPIYRQPDAVFSEAIRRFNVPATEDLVRDGELRRLILPAIRAEFEMASEYRYEPEAPWDVPITCLTGANDAYVSAENARSWGRFTKKRFQLFTLDSEHFIVVDDDRFLLRIIDRELRDPV